MKVDERRAQVQEEISWSHLSSEFRSDSDFVTFGYPSARSFNCTDCSADGFLGYLTQSTTRGAPLKGTRRSERPVPYLRAWESAAGALNSRRRPG